MSVFTNCNVEKKDGHRMDDRLSRYDDSVLGSWNDILYTTYAVSVGLAARVDKQGRTVASERDVRHARTAGGEGLVGHNQMCTTAHVFKLAIGSVEITARTDGGA